MEVMPAIVSSDINVKNFEGNINPQENPRISTGNNEAKRNKKNGDVKAGNRKQESIVDVQNKAKIPKNSEICYPILFDCSQLVKDEFWIQFYRDLSMGKGTKGIFISNGIIQTSAKRNGFSYNITDKTADIIILELHNLLTTRTGICSSKDLVKRKQIIDDINKEFENYDSGKWTSIKRKSVKIMLFLEYILKLKQKHKMTWNMAKQSYHTILNAFESKTHKSKDVDYMNGEIRDIKDLEVRRGILVNVRERAEKEETETRAQQCEMRIELQSLFEPYINAYRKATYNE